MTETPLTDYLVYLLKTRPTREQAGKEARRLGIKITWARYYFEIMV